MICESCSPSPSNVTYYQSLPPSFPPSLPPSLPLSLPAPLALISLFLDGKTSITPSPLTLELVAFYLSQHRHHHFQHHYHTPDAVVLRRSGEFKDRGVRIGPDISFLLILSISITTSYLQHKNNHLFSSSLWKTPSFFGIYLYIFPLTTLEKIDWYFHPPRSLNPTQLHPSLTNAVSPSNINPCYVYWSCNGWHYMVDDCNEYWISTQIECPSALKISFSKISHHAIHTMNCENLISV